MTLERLFDVMKKLEEVAGMHISLIVEDGEKGGGVIIVVPFNVPTKEIDERYRAKDWHGSRN